MPQFFRHKVSQLPTVLEKLEIDWENQDQLNSIDFEDYLLTPKINFSIFTDDEINLYWQLIDVSTKVTDVSDKLVLCTVDDMDLMVYNAGEYVFVFVKEWNLDLVEELISSLL